MKRVCRKARTWDPRLVQLCRNNKPFVFALIQGAKLGMNECRHQLRFHRWNCTEQKRSIAKMLLRGTVSDRKLITTEAESMPFIMISQNYHKNMNNYGKHLRSSNTHRRQSKRCLPRQCYLPERFTAVANKIGFLGTREVRFPSSTEYPADALIVSKWMFLSDSFYCIFFVLGIRLESIPEHTVCTVQKQWLFVFRH